MVDCSPTLATRLDLPHLRVFDCDALKAAPPPPLYDAFLVVEPPLLRRYVFR